VRSCAVAIIIAIIYKIMASSLNKNKIYYKYKIMCLVAANPNITYRQIAREIEISTGAAYNLMTSLISQGTVYIETSDNKKNNKMYSYKLSNIGVREKAILSREILELKKNQLIQLQEEIILLEMEVNSNI
jgi:predicted transcriptional regulator